MRFLSIFVFSISLFSVATSASAQTNLGEYTVPGDRKETMVEIRSSDATTLKIARMCFGMHGKYRVVAPGASSQFVIQINPSGQNAASLMLFSGKPEQLSFRETVTGENQENAVLKAVDRAVYKTSGLRGFFSGKLAFVGDLGGSKELYTSNFLFRNARRWTNDRANIVRPRWDPRGSNVLFSSDKRGGFDIYRVDFRSQRVDTMMSVRNSTNSGAVYSPDGMSIALSSSPKGNPELYVVTRDFKSSRNISNSRNNEAAPSWAPDGRRLVVASGAGGRPQLYTVSSSGGDMRRLATNFSGYCAEPAWNPVNPDQIAFTAAVGRGFQIALYSGSERNSTQVSRESGDAIEAEWLSDGRHLLYTRRTANRRSIMLLDTVSKKTTELSSLYRGNAYQVSFLQGR